MVNKKGIFATALFSSIILSPVAFASDTANSTNTNDSSEVQVANTDNTVSLDNTSNQGVSEDSIASDADTQSSALTQAVGGADTSTTLAEATSTTSADDVKAAVAQNIKSTVNVPASYLENANYSGPFTAGVNQVIPFEAFGGDGMVTRLLLSSSDGAPWSDNGTAKNAALLPVDGLTKDAYTYEVDLNGDTTKLSGAKLLDYLKAQGTKSYQATVKVYDKASGELVTTKDVTVNLQGAAKTTSADGTKTTSADDVKAAVAQNIKSTVNVPASYLENANYPGPFTAGVNQVIPFEAFGGDGMLTRLLLSSSDDAPWSNNGTAKNAALLPVDGLTKDAYTYEVDLNGDTTKLSGAKLLDYLKAQGTKSYQATVKVYDKASGELVATKDVTINLHGTGSTTGKGNGSKDSNHGNTGNSTTGANGMTGANGNTGTNGMTGANNGSSTLPVGTGTKTLATIPTQTSLSNAQAENDAMGTQQNKQASLPDTGENPSLWLTISGVILAVLGAFGAAFKFIRR